MSLLQAFPAVLFPDPCKGELELFVLGCLVYEPEWKGQKMRLVLTVGVTVVSSFTLSLKLVSFITSNTLSLVPAHLNVAIPFGVMSEATFSYQSRLILPTPGLTEVFCISTQTLVPSYPQEQC